jgi:SAM-dependent methyltransferase
MGGIRDANEREDLSTDRDVTPPWESDQRDVLRATFDQDAEAYDRSRPVAPGDVFDEVMQRASLSAGSTVVEIGPGTGQATRHLAARGLDVVAVELGPHLAERARANLAAFPQVSVVTASFESWDPGAARFDGVFACNSFHWIDPDIRFAKAAAVLRRGGHLVVLATPWVVPETADRFWWDVQDDWAAVGARFDPSTMHPDLIRDDLALAVRASGVFEEPTITRRLFEIAFTADGYATNLSTQSGVKELPENARAELIARIHQRVEDQGGRVTAHLLAVLTIARRAGNQFATPQS